MDFAEFVCLLQLAGCCSLLEREMFSGSGRVLCNCFVRDDAVVIVKGLPQDSRAKVGLRQPTDTLTKTTSASSLPYFTLSYLTSPYLTFPYLTLPHLTSPSLCVGP